MKNFIFSIALLTSPLIASAEVGISINIGDPGFYGPLQLTNMPAPQLLYANPLIIERRGGVVYSPLYLRVPPGHYKNWRYYCGRYNACHRPVYFVRDDWYQNVYVPRYRHDHPGRGYARGHDPDKRHWDRGEHHGHHKDWDRDNRRGHKDWDRDGRRDHDDRRGHGRDHDRR